MKIRCFCMILMMTFAFNLHVTDIKAEDDIKVPDFPYKSPEAWSFERYGQFNIGEYTGNPGISIPLYNLKFRDIEVPLTLTYQGSGIRVADEATWVGLGWNLAVGGCITRVSAGGTDPDTRYAPWDKIKELTTSKSDRYFTMQKYSACVPWMHKEGGQFLYGTQELAITTGDAEEDLYCANVLGRTFYFFYDREDDKYKTIGTDGEPFSVERNGGWRIYDSSGNLYEFNDGYSSNTEIGMAGDGSSFISAWNISSITSPTDASVYFHYSDKYRIKYLPKLYERYDFVMGIYNAEITQGGYACSFPLANMEMDKPFLTKITTNDQTISFSLSDRDDIRCTTNIAKPQKLSYITISSKLTDSVIKKIGLYYTYFESDSSVSKRGGDWVTERNYLSGITDYCKKRLRLDSIADITVASDHQKYEFEYYTDKGGLPYKTSYSTDTWGYYNGQENKSGLGGGCGQHTFIPSAEIQAVGTSAAENYQYSGANRFTSSTYINQCSLKKITYPTKGYTQFVYEPHTFTTSVGAFYYPESTSSCCSPITYSCQDINYSGMKGMGPTIAKDIILDVPLKGQITAIFTANKSQGVSIYNMKEKGASVQIALIGGASPLTYTLNLSNVNGDLNSTYTYTMEKDVTLPKGKYKFIAYLPDYFGTNPGLSVQGKLKGLSEAPTFTASDGNVKHVCIGGGMRIKDIINYDSDGKQLQKTSYQYVNKDGASSGLLIEPSRMSQHYYDKIIYKPSPKIPGDFTDYQLGIADLTRVSSSTVGDCAMTSALGLATVGYSRVVKKIEGDETATVVSYYKNAVPQPFGPIYIYPDSCFNGLLSRQEIYSSDNTLVKTVANTYTRVVSNNYKRSIHWDGCGIKRQGIYQLYVYSYPLWWNKLVQTNIEEIQNGLVTSVKSSYLYNQLNHLDSVKEVSMGGGDVYKTVYRYPGDLQGDANYYRMYSKRHILNPVVSEERYTNGCLTWKKDIKYGCFGYNYLPMKVNCSPTGGSLENRMYMSYDSDGNLQYAVKDDIEKEVFLWSYNNMYPVAKIEGVDTADVHKIINPSMISSLATQKNSAVIEDMLNTMRSQLVDNGILVTTYTYKPLFGISSQTAPNGLKTTYEYDAHGRLLRIKDNDDYTISKYEYNYKQ